jgi:hypothetical protein
MDHVTRFDPIHSTRLPHSYLNRPIALGFNHPSVGDFPDLGVDGLQVGFVRQGNLATTVPSDESGFRIDPDPFAILHLDGKGHKASVVSGELERPLSVLEFLVPLLKQGIGKTGFPLDGQSRHSVRFRQPGFHFQSAILQVGEGNLHRRSCRESWGQPPKDALTNGSRVIATGITAFDHIGRIEIQGDQRERIVAELEKLGFKVKRVGG